MCTVKKSEVVQSISDAAVTLLVMIIPSCEGGGYNKVINTLEQLKKKSCNTTDAKRCGTQLYFIVSSHPGEKWDYS